MNNILMRHLKDRSLWLGLLVVALISVVSLFLSYFPFITRIGFSALTVGIILGIIVGNLPIKLSKWAGGGVYFSKQYLLRLGIMLYGFKITIQQVLQIGWTGLVDDILIIVIIFFLTYFLATRVFKTPTLLSMLIGVGSSICGAAAVIGASPILKGKDSEVSVAVATVVIFGSIAIFIYPPLYNVIVGAHILTNHQFGVYTGNSIHEVAQVVAASKPMGGEASHLAVITKMVRVMLLAPFLVCLSIWASRNPEVQARRQLEITPPLKKDEIKPEINEKPKKAKIAIPYFAIIFILVAVINSFHWFNPIFIKNVTILDNFLLTMAMTALGMATHVKTLMKVGIKPILLGLTIFIMLIVIGFFLEWGVSHFFALFNLY